MSRNRRVRPNKGSNSDSSRPIIDTKTVTKKDDSISNKSTAPQEPVDKGAPNDSRGEMPTAGNDPDWYGRDARLLEDAARVPFSLPFGAHLDFFEGVSVMPGPTSPSSSLGVRGIPGVCSLVIKPTAGYAGDKTAPLNVCANALYTHVRYINSGRKNYDPADLMLYTAAFGEIYSFITWCQRLYQYAFMYSQRNWFIGKDVILANRVNADNLVTNLANFRYWLNSIINKVSSFCIPGDIYYFKRRVFMFSNYYLENGYGNLKDQIYQFIPAGFYAFAYDSNSAGKLAYNTLPAGDANGLLTIDHIAAYFEQILMGNITGDEDFGLMSGDILKAYGDNIIHIAQMEPEGGLLPVHDPYVLSQFKNAHIYPVYCGDSTKTYKDAQGNSHVFGDIEQSTDGLLLLCEGIDWSTAAGKRLGTLAGAKKILTVENPDPGVGDVIEATRLMPFLGLYPNNDGSGTYFYSLNGGTEIVIGMIITQTPAANGHTINYIPYNANVFSSAEIAASSHRLVRNLEAFKYAPVVYESDIDSNDVLTYFAVMSNLDNTTFVDSNILKRLHDTALLSLFYVPGVSKIIS